MTSNLRKGIFAIIASAFGFATMAFCVRLTDDFGAPVGAIQKSFFRNLIAFAIALAAFLAARRAPTKAGLVPPRGRDWWALIARATFGTLGIFANFYALSRIPIAEGQTLNKVAPFVTVLAAWLFLGEKVSLRQALSLVIAFVGALLVMKPGFRAAGSLAALAGLGGGVAAGVAYVCLRELGRHGVSGSFIVLFFSFFSCLASVPFICFGYTPMTLAQLVVLLGAGAGAALGQFGITAAYRYAQPRQIAVFDYTNILFTAAYGLLFFGQVPDLLSILGFAAIVFAAVRMHG